MSTKSLEFVQPFQLSTKQLMLSFKVNVIAFGDEATSVEAVEELRALAIPVDRFSVNPQLASRPSLETEGINLTCKMTIVKEMGIN